MIKVAHRGNIHGRQEHLENQPYYVLSAIADEYYCEVDVWKTPLGFFLGHDKPQYPVTIKFLKNEKLICHAKNINALHSMLKDSEIHCFWHEKDYCTITSKGWVWKYPEVYFQGKLLGICSDWL
mgnify:CR=1 FL=1|tara:strand:- start:12 stop:383 length:372 start_codon:yes stop_codon:yes gene_type:complete